MNIFGLTIAKTKSLIAAPRREGVIHEPFTGAWQRGMEVDSTDSLLSFSAVYSCVTRIATDISKMRLKMVQKIGGIYCEVPDTARNYTVIQKPNHFQNRIKFFEYWVTSKLLHGNTYILKKKDNHGNITSLYILDPRSVTPLIADDGSVFYQIKKDNLANTEGVTIPASFIIHDRMECLYHPLIGVSPITACAMSATLGNKIQKNSGAFFENMSRPSGVLTTAGQVSNETIARLKKEWEQSYSSGNIGKVAVLADGLTYGPMAISAADSQLIEQLKWSVADVARAFKVPLYKIDENTKTSVGIDLEAINQSYYMDCLQGLIENIELCLDEGLELSNNVKTEFELSNLFRMDTKTRYEAHEKAVKAGWMSPNEARQSENLPPVKGGDTPYMQQQNWSLEALADRNLEGDLLNSGKDIQPDDGIKDKSDTDIQQTALNGAQVTALQGVIFSVARGELPTSTAAVLIKVAFPLVSDDDIEAMLKDANIRNIENPIQDKKDDSE